MEQTLLERIQDARNLLNQGRLPKSTLTELLSDLETQLSAAEIDDTQKVDIALSTLSFSEDKALTHIFAALPGPEGGLIVASKVADEAEITRSVIVNGIRKLESAGVLQARSLGMKGTMITKISPMLWAKFRQTKAA